jgi:hypothetical protein
MQMGAHAQPARRLSGWWMASACLDGLSGRSASLTHSRHEFESTFCFARPLAEIGGIDKYTSLVKLAHRP